MTCSTFSNQLLIFQNFIFWFAHIRFSVATMREFFNLNTRDHCLTSETQLFWCQTNKNNFYEQTGVDDWTISLQAKISQQTKILFKKVIPEKRSGKRQQENLNPKTYTQIFICRPRANACCRTAWKMKFICIDILMRDSFFTQSIWINHFWENL